MRPRFGEFHRLRAIQRDRSIISLAALGSDMATDSDTGDLCDRYADLYTGVVADVLDERGYPDRTIQGEVAPLDRSMTMAGVAFPAVGRRNDGVDPETQIRDHLRMVGHVPPHGVLVIETNDGASAQVGELMTTAIRAQDGRGCVLDGGVRDTSFILDQGFPVFAAYRTPEDSVPRWELLDWDVDVVVGGVDVSPGDVVVGDVDGVVVPGDVAREVLEAAEKKVAAEDRVRRAIREGATPLEAYEDYGVF